jgi:hypothetical protein
MQHPCLYEFADLLVAHGFTVLMSPDPNWQTYFFFSDGKNIGYVEYDRSRGFRFSTVHKPNLQTGTGYSIDEGMPTIENAKKAFIVAPAWARNDKVNKYRDLQEFMTAQTRQKWGEMLVRYANQPKETANG